MTTALFTHPACIEHDPGYGHPEGFDRLRAVLAALDGEAFVALDRRSAPSATIEQIARAHDRGYVETFLASVPAAGRNSIDPDTILSPRSGEAALRAAGAAIAAVDAVLAEEVQNAFCAIRPPGHHAGRAFAMGFCFLNNAAIAALHAHARGLERVAVVDFDVHHGNGTQDILGKDSSFLYCSLHQAPLYPGTGTAADVGEAGNCLNVPLAAGTEGGVFRAAVTDLVLPALERFRPEMLILSAGFDSHSRDPLAGLLLEDADFAWISQALCAFAQRRCRGRMVSVLEGGYDLRALGTSVAAHVRELMAV